MTYEEPHFCPTGETVWSLNILLLATFHRLKSYAGGCWCMRSFCQPPLQASSTDAVADKFMFLV